jgi:multidrug resistance efflux pump
VQAGQVLAALDTTDFELEAAQAEQTYLNQQAAYSATIQPDPQAVAAAEAAVSSAAAAYQAARQKFNQRQDQITTTCLEFKGVRCWPGAAADDSV